MMFAAAATAGLSMRLQHGGLMLHCPTNSLNRSRSLSQLDKTSQQVHEHYSHSVFLGHKPALKETAPEPTAIGTRKTHRRCSAQKRAGRRKSLSARFYDLAEDKQDRLPVVNPLQHNLTNSYGNGTLAVLLPQAHVQLKLPVLQQRTRTARAEADADKDDKQTALANQLAATLT